MFSPINDSSVFVSYMLNVCEVACCCYVAFYALIFFKYALVIFIEDLQCLEHLSFYMVFCRVLFHQLLSVVFVIRRNTSTVYSGVQV